MRDIVIARLLKHKDAEDGFGFNHQFLATSYWKGY